MPSSVRIKTSNFKKYENMRKGAKALRKRIQCSISLILACAIWLTGLQIPVFAENHTNVVSDTKIQESAVHLYQLGLLDGTGTHADGTPNFNLSATMTRGEAIVMVVRLLGGKNEAITRNYTHPFTDVSSWAAPYVGYAYTYGITAGVSEDTFGFEDKITMQEYMTLLLRGIGYDVNWKNPYVTAAQVGLVEGVDYVKTDTFLRSDMVMLSDSFLHVTVPDLHMTLYDALNKMGVLLYREIPQPGSMSVAQKPIAQIVPGPVSQNVSNQIIVNRIDDMIDQIAVIMDARFSDVTIYTPIGQEQAFCAALLSQDIVDRFPDHRQMNATIYHNAGYFTVNITYKDAARVMAYMEGKSSSLTAEDMALYAEAKRVHDSLVSADMSEYERVKAFHDYLCETVTYQEYGDTAHTAYGALVNHAAVCEGYTLAMDLLCYLSGIDCEHIFGFSRNQAHSWVRVNVDGIWYNIDTTWDDQEQGIRYTYFMVSDATMRKDHDWKDNPNWSVCLYDYVP